MSGFKRFKAAVNAQFAGMSEHALFVTDVNSGDMWDTYLNSFPEGTNSIFRERTTHDCQCCKQFIRAGGNAVALINGEMRSIWDIDIGGHHQVVADALSKLVKSQPIKDVFLHYEDNLGTDYNHQLTDSGETLK